MKAFASAAGLAMVYCVALAVLVPRSHGQAKPRGKPTSPQSAPQPPPRGPYQLYELFELLLSPIGKQADSYVERFGISDDARASEEVIDILRKLGASQAFVDRVPRAVLAVPVYAGDLTVKCIPDCEIRIGDRYYGQTDHSARIIKGLAPGQIEIFASQTGFQSKVLRRILVKEMPIEVTFELEPGVEVKENAARQRTLRILRALGGTRGLVEASQRRVRGHLSLWADPNRSTVNTTVDLTTSVSSAKAEFDNQTCEVGTAMPPVCRSAGRTTTAKSTEKRSPVEEKKRIFDIASAVQLVHQNSLWELASDFIEGDVNLDEDSTGLPRRIRYRRGEATFTVEFQNFKKVGHALLPEEVSISPGPQGYVRLSIHFDL